MGTGSKTNLTPFPGSAAELRACQNSAMDIALVVIVAVIAAAGGLGIGFLLGVSRGGGGERRLAELQAQLTAARENANRLGVQSAELEREAERLRGQLLESVQQGSQVWVCTLQLELRL